MEIDGVPKSWGQVSQASLLSGGHLPPRNYQFRNFNADPLVCRVDEIIPILENWIRKHDAYHPPERSFETRPHHGIYQFGAQTYLAHELGLPQDGFNLAHVKRQTYMTLDRADAILTSIGEQSALTDGRVRVIPNQTWSREKWVEYMRERGCM